jgi:hypothetical protein
VPASRQQHRAVDLGEFVLDIFRSQHPVDRGEAFRIVA